MKKQFRHGDLLLESIDTIPSEAKVRNSNIILEGETTGHAHRVSGGSILEVGEQMYVAVPDAGAVTHEEHNRIELPAGNYRVIRQREYRPYDRAVRAVID